MRRRNAPQKRSADFEASLGARIRAARVGVGLSQAALAEALGISFQQVQKYEKGADRVAVSTLDSIATVLGVPLVSFLDDETQPPTGKVSEVREAMAVGANWQRIRNPKLREQFAKLLATLAEEGARIEAAPEAAPP